MKKSLLSVLVLSLATLLVAGCNNTPVEEELVEENAVVEANLEEVEEEAEEVVEEADVKVEEVAEEVEEVEEVAEEAEEVVEEAAE